MVALVQPIAELDGMWVTVNDLPIYTLTSAYTTPKTAQPVVLVPGLAVGAGNVVPTAAQLAHSYRVYAPELPGFGCSDKPSRVLSVPELADALVCWMRSAEVERATLIGSSFGCQVVANAAARYPERVASLVLAGPTVDPRARSFARQFWRWLVNFSRELPDSDTLRDYKAAGLRRILLTLCFALQDRIEEKLPYIQAETLVVRGERDPVVPQRWAEEATRLLPAGRLAVIPGAAHFVAQHAPLPFSQVVRSFLKEGEQGLRAGRPVASQALRS